MNDVTQSGTGSGSLIEVPAMSPVLRRCVDRCQKQSRFLGDEDSRLDSEVMDTWIPPKWVSEALRDEAARLLPVYERWSQAVSEQTLQRWVNVLWVGLPKAKGTPETWEAVKIVYFAMLDDFPALCFSKRSMMAARDRFKFFPGTNELAAFLLPYRNDVTNTVYRLRVIAHTTTERGNFTAAPEERKGRTEQELQAVGDICKGIYAGLERKS
jgi:hypothetical protein